MYPSVRLMAFVAVIATAVTACASASTDTSTSIAAAQSSTAPADASSTTVVPTTTLISTTTASTTTASTTTTTTQPPTTTTTAKPPDVYVGMKTTDENGPQFTGANKTIVKGTKVVWSNKDGEETHDVKSDVFYSGLLGPGKMFSYIFTEAGTYPYFCPLHFGMDGTITVTDG